MPSLWSAARLLFRCFPRVAGPPKPRPAQRTARRAGARPSPPASRSAGQDADATRSASHHTPGSVNAFCSPVWGMDADAPSCDALAGWSRGRSWDKDARPGSGGRLAGWDAQEPAGRTRAGNPGTGTWPRPMFPLRGVPCALSATTPLDPVPAFFFFFPPSRYCSGNQCGGSALSLTFPASQPTALL